MEITFLKSSLAFASMTFLSRIFGLIRDYCIARYFGANGLTDAFLVAFRIPNFLRRLFGEGAFSQAFVPILAQVKANQSAQEVQDVINHIGTKFLTWLIIITAISIIIAPVLIFMFAWGFYFAEDATQFNLATDMLRITFPYLLLISLTAFAGAILNTYQNFIIPAFTPVLLNISMILSAIYLSNYLQTPIMALAWGVLLGGILQLALQIPFLIKIKKLPRLQRGSHPAVKTLKKRMLPALFGVSVGQINLLIDTMIASVLVSGSISWLYYSDRLVEFPLGIFGIALATVILPNLSKNHAAKNAEAFSRSLDWGLKLVVLIGVPASLGLIMLAEPMVSTLFQYHHFGVNDVIMTGRSLMAYSVGLLGFILVKVLVPGFTSRKDMKTPVRFGIYAMVANMVLNIALVFPLAHAGLALATSLGAFFNASLLLSKLLKTKIYRPATGWRVFILRIILATSAMASLLYHCVDTSLWHDWGLVDRAMNLAMWIVIAATLYAVVLWLSGLRLRHLSAR